MRLTLKAVAPTTMDPLWSALGGAPFADALRADQLRQTQQLGYNKLSSNVQRLTFKRRREELGLLLNETALVTRAAALVRRLRSGDRGMSWAAGLGLWFKTTIRMGPTSTSLLSDVDVRAALRLLAFETPRPPHVDACLVNMRLMESDLTAREHSVIEPPIVGEVRVGAAIHSLRRDGFLKVGNWSQYGLDVARLSAQANDVFKLLHDEVALAQGGGPSTAPPDSYRSTGSRCCAQLPVPTLDAFLRSPALAAVVRAYLGGQARYDGHLFLEITPSASEESYRSGMWHHDRCGRRLVRKPDSNPHPSCPACASSDSSIQASRTHDFANTASRCCC